MRDSKNVNKDLIEFIYTRHLATDHNPTLSASKPAQHNESLQI